MLNPMGQSARRWPIITFALIAINVVVFLLTRGDLRQDRAQVAEVKQHILTLAAIHPELDVAPEAREFVFTFSARNPGEMNQLRSADRPYADQWGRKITKHRE